jgi:hypothetical protein
MILRTLQGLAASLSLLAMTAKEMLGARLILAWRALGRHVYQQVGVDEAQWLSSL